MSEEQAFDMLKFLMYDLGIRRQYRPDMVSLQVGAQMNQSTSFNVLAEINRAQCVVCTHFCCVLFWQQSKATKQGLVLFEQRFQRGNSVFLK